MRKFTDFSPLYIQLCDAQPCKRWTYNIQKYPSIILDEKWRTNIRRRKINTTEEKQTNEKQKPIASNENNNLNKRIRKQEELVR